MDTHLKEYYLNSRSIVILCKSANVVFVNFTFHNVRLVNFLFLFSYSSSQKECKIAINIKSLLPRSRHTPILHIFHTTRWNFGRKKVIDTVKVLEAFLFLQMQKLFLNINKNVELKNTVYGRLPPLTLLLSMPQREINTIFDTNVVIKI